MFYLKDYKSHWYKKGMRMTKVKCKKAMQPQQSLVKIAYTSRLHFIQLLRELSLIFILIVYFEWELSHGFSLARNLGDSVVSIAVWMKAWVLLTSAVSAGISKTRKRRLLFCTHFTAHSLVCQPRKEMRVDGFMPHWGIKVTSSWKMSLGP